MDVVDGATVKRKTAGGDVVDGAIPVGRTAGGEEHRCAKFQLGKQEKMTRGEQQRGIIRGRNLPRLSFLIVSAVCVTRNLALAVACGGEAGTGGGMTELRWERA